MQVPLDDSLAAWRGSIKAAGGISPVGEYIVSAHFSRIARMRIQMEVDPSDIVNRLSSFAREEEAVQEKLEWQIPLPKPLVELADLLQFSDVLSLYLCRRAIAIAVNRAPLISPKAVRSHFSRSSANASARLWPPSANTAADAVSSLSDSSISRSKKSDRPKLASSSAVRHSPATCGSASPIRAL